MCETNAVTIFNHSQTTCLTLFVRKYHLAQNICNLCTKGGPSKLAFLHLQLMINKNDDHIYIYWVLYELTMKKYQI